MNPGTKIKELRKSRGWTQEDLGERLGVKKAAVQKYEKGEIINLKLATIQKLCEIFEVTPATFIFPEAEELDRVHNSRQLHFEVKALETIEELYGFETVEMIETFTKLNKTGKNRAIETVHDLALVNKYTEV